MNSRPTAPVGGVCFISLVHLTWARWFFVTSPLFLIKPSLCCHLVGARDFKSFLIINTALSAYTATQCGKPVKFQYPLNIWSFCFKDCLLPCLVFFFFFLFGKSFISRTRILVPLNFDFSTGTFVVRFSGLCLRKLSRGFNFGGSGSWKNGNVVARFFFFFFLRSAKNFVCGPKLAPIVPL